MEVAFEGPLGSEDQLDLRCFPISHRFDLRVQLSLGHDLIDSPSQRLQEASLDSGSPSGRRHPVVLGTMPSHPFGSDLRISYSTQRGGR